MVNPDYNSCNQTMLISENTSLVDLAMNNTGRPSSTKQDRKRSMPRSVKQGENKAIDSSSNNYGSMFEDEDDGGSSNNEPESPPDSHHKRSVGQNKANGQIGDISNLGSTQ